MMNVASFIKGRFNIVENSLLVMVLLGLEKLMDMEFRCPADRPLAIAYSSVFLFVPTVIVWVMACYLSPGGMCCRRGSNAEINSGAEEGDIAESETSMVAVETETENATCSRCCAIMPSCAFKMKAIVSWILIVLTDGRYGECLVKSVGELIELNNSNISDRKPLLSWIEIQDNYLIQMSQIIGLIGILLIIIVVVCLQSKICSCLSCGCNCGLESESERCRRMNEDNLLQITEDLLQEQARQRQKDFVVTLLSREKWTSYNPRSPKALQELGNIIAKWKQEVKRQLKRAGLGRAESEGAPTLSAVPREGQPRNVLLLPPHRPPVFSNLNPEPEILQMTLLSEPK